MTAEPLTEQQFNDIQARADVATDGPWERYEKYGPDFFACINGSHLCGVGSFNFGDGTDAAADEEFVKHAVQDVRALLAETRRLKAVAADLAARWEKEAAGTQVAIDTDPLGGEVEAAQHERVHTYRTAASDLREVLATGRIPSDLITPAEAGCPVTS